MNQIDKIKLNFTLLTILNIFLDYEKSDNIMANQKNIL